METSAEDNHHEKPWALSDHLVQPMARLCPLHQNQTKTTSSPHIPLHSSHYSQGLPLSLSPSPLPPPPSQDSAHFGKHRLRFGKGKRERGFFFKTQFSGIFPSENRGPGGGSSRARMGSGSHRGERDGRCYTGKQRWDGETGGAPTGARLSRGKQLFWGPGSRTTSGCKGQEGSWDTPLCSSPNSCPNLQIQQRDTTGCSHPAQGQTPVQQSGHKIPKGHQILPGHISPVPALPPPLPAPCQGTFAEQLSRSLGTS